MNEVERGEALRAIVEELKGKEVVYGEDDCSMVPAQWVADVTGKVLEWPLYDSREEAERVIKEGGGLVAVWDRVLRSAGIEERHLYPGEAPGIGDVGIIETSQGPVGGIFLASGAFLWRAEHGVRIVGARVYVMRRDENGPFRKPIVLKVWAV